MGVMEIVVDIRFRCGGGCGGDVVKAVGEGYKGRFEEFEEKL